MTISFYEFMTTVQPYSDGTAIRYDNAMNRIIPKIPLHEILTGDIDTFPVKVMGKSVTNKTLRSIWRPAVKKYREYHEFLGTQIK
jgi:hypothetical protein